MRGFDYRAYKRPTLMRRFEKRMQAMGAKTYEEYRDYLEAEPREFNELFDTILINMTSFFRDAPAWEHLRTKVLPALVQGKEDGEAIRVWSAGCSSGEEAYTAAMLLADELGDEEYRRRVKIYATDIDELALNEGRHGRYGTKAVEAVPEELRARYFQSVDGEYAISGELRRSVIFGRNDLLTDPPISRVDLLISRNTLMYFAPPAQMRVLSNFFFALNRTGYVFFGKAETFQTRTSFFNPLEQRQRIFVKNAKAVPEPRVTLVVPETLEAPSAGDEETRLREVGFDHAPIAQLVVDVGGRLTLANQHARTLFGLAAPDLGHRLQDLELSYRPVDLRTPIDTVLAERRMVSIRDAVWTDAGGDQRHFDVQVSPLVDGGGDVIGTTIAFFDVSRAESLRQDLERAKRELETAYEELQSTVEELETTNEELQSTNEELETTNEELQSTNEELETMNEELHSTNEELETMNDELRERTDEALGANAFLTGVLGSIHQSVVVLDPELRVLAWSDAAAELWGLRPDEVAGQFFLNLDIGLPVGDLRAPILRTFVGKPSEDVTLEARNRRGQPVDCTVSFAELTSHTGDVDGAILVMTAEPRDETS